MGKDDLDLKQPAIFFLQNQSGRFALVDSVHQREAGRPCYALHHETANPIYARGLASVAQTVD
jgi:hypothetical protein